MHLGRQRFGLRRRRGRRFGRAAGIAVGRASSSRRRTILEDDDGGASTPTRCRAASRTPSAAKDRGRAALDHQYEAALSNGATGRRARSPRPRRRHRWNSPLTAEPLDLGRPDGAAQGSRPWRARGGAPSPPSTPGTPRAVLIIRRLSRSTRPPLAAAKCSSSPRTSTARTAPLVRRPVDRRRRRATASSRRGSSSTRRRRARRRGAHATYAVQLQPWTPLARQKLPRARAEGFDEARPPHAAAADPRRFQNGREGSWAGSAAAADLQLEKNGKNDESALILTSSRRPAAARRGLSI